MKKVIITSVVALFFLAGCNMNTTDDDAAQKDRNPTVEQTRYNDGNKGNHEDRYKRNEMQNDQQKRTSDKNRDRDERYDVSKEIADAITREVPEVHGAYVLTMGDRAYVAARFDEEDSKNNVPRNEGMNRKNNYDDDKNRDEVKEEKNSQVKNKNVGKDRKEESGQLTDDLKEKISSVVREKDTSINDVYVTTNPEFSNLARDYMDDVDEGNPIGGFFDQMGSMIERLFPQHK